MGQKHSSSKIGLVRLIQTTNPESNHPVVNDQIMQIFKDSQWQLQQGRIKKFKLERILPFIKQAKITFLNMAANNVDTLPMTLSKINFPNLLRLRLCGNGISSIEPLINLQASQLIQLSMSWNYITSSRPLRKVRFPNLKYLNLQQNCLHNVGEDLTCCSFPQLRELFLQTTSKSLVVCDHIETWCIKWQCSSLYQIVICSSKRIQLEKRSNNLRQRYTFLKIFRSGFKPPA